MFFTKGKRLSNLPPCLPQIPKSVNGCEICGGEINLWDMEIRDGYRCFKCGAPMRILLIFPPEAYDPQPELRQEIPMRSEFAYAKDPSIIPLAKECGVLLEKRFSKTIKTEYIAHICPKCRIIQGDNYVVEDLHQETELIAQFKSGNCGACGTWVPYRIAGVSYFVEPLGDSVEIMKPLPEKKGKREPTLMSEINHILGLKKFSRGRLAKTQRKEEHFEK